MKKLALILVILLVISMPLQAYAATRAAQTTPNLSISGTTARCFASVLANSSTDHLEVTMRLENRNRIVATWTSEGYGSVVMNETTRIGAGRTYKLIVEVKENGVARDPVYVTVSC